MEAFILGLIIWFNAKDGLALKDYVSIESVNEVVERVEAYSAKEQVEAYSAKDAKVPIDLPAQLPADILMDRLYMPVVTPIPPIINPRPVTDINPK
jgi:hypothetical protein